MKRVLKSRAGTTLLETLVALTLLGALITATLSLLNDQMRTFNSGATQGDAVQNLRFALSELEKDLAPLGTNIGPDQPFLVYADTHVIAFNADYVSNVAHDAYSVYVDTSASGLISTSVTKPRRFQIPLTSFFYPDTTYRVGAANSPAETIIFYFQLDATTTRTDDYQLMRKVNDQAADLVASGILKMTGLPFFQYMELITPVSGLPFVQPVTVLPRSHSRPLHGAVNDTGSFALIDRMRSIRVNFRVTDGQPGARERIYSAARTLWFANAGIKIKNTCGDEPILGSIGFMASNVTVDGVPAIRLNWNRASDEAAGEQDVVRYVIYRTAPLATISDPYLSVPAGNASYEHLDYNITPLTTYVYSIAAQDCTPSLSSIATAAALATPVW